MTISLTKRICRPAGVVTHRRIGATLVSPAALIRSFQTEPAGPLVLLDSAGGNPHLCRYSFLAWDPRLQVTIKDRKAVLRSGGRAHELIAADPFALLRQLIEEMAPAHTQEPLGAASHPGGSSTATPITGGAFGTLSYDAGRYIERLPALAADDLGLPEFDFIFPRKLICFDHAAAEAHIWFEDVTAAEIDRAAAAIRRQERADPPDSGPDLQRHAFSLSSVTRSNTTAASFQHMVRRAKEYILAGDIFQSNLSQRLELEYGGDPLELYESLRLVNPSPFAGYLDMGGYQLISSSPERLVQLQGRRAQTRPIAGTRRRGADLGEDDDLLRELNLDPKERAEHIMLVDLERNDMGRVCDYGTVHVDELMVNEAYSHVIHIVSNVRGVLHDRKDALDLLRAMFPGGTITGCPKVRCMEIIDELEPVRRGPYTGSFGYIGYNGDMDMNIIIRTLLRVGDRVFGQVGAGIVADSDPRREYQETLRKAEAMVRAVEHVKKSRRPGRSASGADPSPAG